MKKLLCILLFVPLAFFGQTSSNDNNKKDFTIGWVGNLNHAPLGFYFLIPDDRFDFNWYLDFKMNTGGKIEGKDYNGTITTNESINYGDEFLGEKSGDVLIINFGSSFFLKEFKNFKISCYSALGIGWMYQHQQYYDESRILSSSGYYYHSEDVNISPNLSMGTTLSFEKVNFLLGIDLYPKSINLGVGIPLF